MRGVPGVLMTKAAKTIRKIAGTTPISAALVLGSGLGGIGHLLGDKVIRQVAQNFRSSVQQACAHRQPARARQMVHDIGLHRWRDRPIGKHAVEPAAPP